MVKGDFYPLLNSFNEFKTRGQIQIRPAACLKTNPVFKEKDILNYNYNMATDKISSIPTKWWLKKTFYIPAIINLMLSVFVISGRTFLPPVVPLYFGYPEGERQLALSFWLITPAIFAICILVINTLFARIINDKFLEKTLEISAFTASFFSVISIIKIFFLVGGF